jgi:hypothetical protein
MITIFFSILTNFRRKKWKIVLINFFSNYIAVFRVKTPIFAIFSVKIIFKPNCNIGPSYIEPPWRGWHPPPTLRRAQQLGGPIQYSSSRL